MHHTKPTHGEKKTTQHKKDLLREMLMTATHCNTLQQDLVEETLIKLHVLPGGLCKTQRNLFRNITVAVPCRLGALVPLPLQLL